MKIAIEAQRIFRPNKHGMDFVILESIKQLQKIDRVNEYFILVADGEDKCISETGNFHIIELNSIGGYPVWEQIVLPHYVRKIKPDILHCTSNTAPVNIHIPLILTLHDIIFLEKQSGKNKSLYQTLGRMYRKIIVPRVLNNCAKIITVSDFEKNRITDFLQLNPGKIVSVYNGYSDHFYRRENYMQVAEKYTLGKKYLFFLGNTDPKKNTLNTLKAYALYVSQTNDPAYLLIADLDKDALKSYLDICGLQDISHLIFCPGYIPNQELPFIYSGAQAFLYTSLRESFGIPLLEAMACGTPVITSNTSALPEIAGAGAILTDPTNPSDIAMRLIQLESDPEYRAAAIKYGYERIKLYSWENTAKELLNLYLRTGSEYGITK